MDVNGLELRARNLYSGAHHGMCSCAAHVDGHNRSATTGLVYTHSWCVKLAILTSVLTIFVLCNIVLRAEARSSAPCQPPPQACWTRR